MYSSRVSSLAARARRFHVNFAPQTVGYYCALAIQYAIHATTDIWGWMGAGAGNAARKKLELMMSAPVHIPPACQTSTHAAQTHMQISSEDAYTCSLQVVVL